MVISNEKTLGELVAEIPGAARILEKYRIDYCCGGKHALEAACRERGITQEVLSSELEQAGTLQLQTGEREWNTAPLRELIDHILSRHHAYLKSELPRIAELFAKVVRAHGDREPVLFQVRETFTALRDSEEGRAAFSQPDGVVPPTKAAKTLLDWRAFGGVTLRSSVAELRRYSSPHVSPAKRMSTMVAGWWMTTRTTQLRLLLLRWHIPYARTRGQ